MYRCGCGHRGSIGGLASAFYAEFELRKVLSGVIPVPLLSLERLVLIVNLSPAVSCEPLRRAAVVNASGSVRAFDVIAGPALEPRPEHQKRAQARRS